LPKAKDVIKDVVAGSATGVSGKAQEQLKSEKTYLQKFNNAAVDREAAYAHLQGLRDHYKHKGKWSYFLMAVLLGMVVFQWYLLGKVGSGIWDFTKYKWLLPILLVQNLGQIIGLAFVVVKSLFR
jgi:hypothetical protein